MDHSFQNVFAPYPHVVKAHFTQKTRELSEKLQGTDLVLQFYGDYERRGPGIVRVILKTATFHDFDETTLLTGGKCFCLGHLFLVTEVVHVDRMCKHIQTVADAVLGLSQYP